MINLQIMFQNRSIVRIFQNEISLDKVHAQWTGKAEYSLCSNLKRFCSDFKSGTNKACSVLLIAGRHEVGGY
jgi:hypothetical protein